MDLEKIVSENLRKYPKLRTFIKLTYQRVMYTLSKVHKSKYHNMVREIRVTPKEKEHFFGYYDKSPWNRTQKYILTLEVPFSDRHPQQGDKAIIGIINSKNYQFTPLVTTNTWNLQQGSMEQWLGPEFDNKIIYNDMINNKYVSIIYNIETKEKRIIGRPIYSVSKDGKKAVSLNFSRLHRLRPGYGYANLSDDTKGKNHPSDDGIWYVDLEKNTSKLIISLEDIVNINPNETMKDAQHKFNHLDINPDRTRFMFLHRWEKKNIKHSRLYTANLDGTDLYCLADDQMISHCCWKNNHQILGWLRKKDIGDRYYLLNDKTTDYEIMGDGVLNMDGHPSYSPSGRYILTDTYPDKTRMRTLIIYDTVEKKRYDVGKYFAPFKYDGEVRCDLHPRWSRDGGKICFDSVHEGKRQLYIVDNPLVD